MRAGMPAVRGILPLTDIDALNRLARTLCDVLETTLAVSPPAPTNEAVAVPALTPQEFLFSALLDGPRPATAVVRVAREQHGVAAEGAVQGPTGDAGEDFAPRFRPWRILDLEFAGLYDRLVSQRQLGNLAIDSLKSWLVVDRKCKRKTFIIIFS
jgi:hypothetical protein